jgi:hypothetical protein
MQLESQIGQYAGGDSYRCFSIYERALVIDMHT